MQIQMCENKNHNAWMRGDYNSSRTEQKSIKLTLSGAENTSLKELIGGKKKKKKSVDNTEYLWANNSAE